MARTIAVTGGKGGTGKSTVATALAAELAKRHRVLLVDADVECPNDHLIMKVKQTRLEYTTQMVPRFDMRKCTKCGRCVKACNSNAIVQLPGKFPMLFKEQCNGCNACTLVCPAGAISQGTKRTGAIRAGKGHGLDLISGFMDVGHEEPTPVVKALTKMAGQLSGYDYHIIDTAPGAHCNVIAALEKAEQVLAVTEPTPLGAHDLRLILELLEKLGKKGQVVLNRSDIGSRKDVRAAADEHGSAVIAEIPYSESIVQAYCHGRPIQDTSIAGLAEVLECRKSTQS